MNPDKLRALIGTKISHGSYKNSFHVADEIIALPEMQELLKENKRLKAENESLTKECELCVMTQEALQNCIDREDKLKAELAECRDMLKISDSSDIVNGYKTLANQWEGAVNESMVIIRDLRKKLAETEQRAKECKEKAEKWDIYGLLAGGTDNLNKALDDAEKWRKYCKHPSDAFAKVEQFDSILSMLEVKEKCNGTGYTTRPATSADVKEFIVVVFNYYKNDFPLKSGEILRMKEKP